MKRASIYLLALLAMAVPRLAHAQYSQSNNIIDDEAPQPYNDVEDGQALRIAGYILAPFGYALEWTLTRPMHYLATDTALSPVLSGDTDMRYFGETGNSDRLPPETFAPFRMPANPNAIVSDSTPPPEPQAMAPSRRNVLPPVPSYVAPPYSSGQPALH